MIEAMAVVIEIKDLYTEQELAELGLVKGSSWRSSKGNIATLRHRWWIPGEWLCCQMDFYDGRKVVEMKPRQVVEAVINGQLVPS